MDDKRIIALLARRAAGEISEEESTELQELLSAHPDGVYYEEFFNELWSPYGDEGGTPPDTDDFFTRHRQRYGELLDFSRGIGTGSAGLGWFSRRHLVIYGLLLLVVAGGFLVFRILDGNVVPEGIEIVSERGMRKQIVLPDGTKVWLNADSRLSYDGLMEGTGPRNVRLEGEAYFDVVKNRNRPFIITTDKISIRVLGTAFNVKAYPDERETEATLISGEIELSVNERPGERILLKPNEKVAVVDHPRAEERGGGDEKRLTLTIGNLSKVQLNDREYIEETLWMNNKLVVRDERLGDIVPKLERWYNVNITLRDPEIRSYRYTATITEENIHDVLEAMQLIKSFHFKIDSNDVVIY